IYALPIEITAAKLILDAIYPSLPRPLTNQNNYILGNIGDYNIVIANLPSGVYGIVSAVILLLSFYFIWFDLIVGISEGIPSSKADI
ncbi:uncharacterized protein N7506_003900, partial [Penicillium brevicompactum]|uniref:uncharacterized protein n=1 Tax=Penicillium brevicompactum TaxID=5074 RepID=UPI00254040C3